MKIPKTCKIGGYNYEVKFVENRTKDNGDSHPASVSSQWQKIFIDSNQHKEGQESSFIHEILEAIDYHYQIGLPHDKISVLETALYGVLSENNLLK